jgi:hypothetical protein
MSATIRMWATMVPLLLGVRDKVPTTKHCGLVPEFVIVEGLILAV